MKDDEEGLEGHMDAWFEGSDKAGEFSAFVNDMADAWKAGKLNLKTKLALRRAWRLNRHYLNGVQKRRK